MSVRNYAGSPQKPAVPGDVAFILRPEVNGKPISLLAVDEHGKVANLANIVKVDGKYQINLRWGNSFMTALATDEDGFVVTGFVDEPEPPAAPVAPAVDKNALANELAQTIAAVLGKYIH